MDTTPAKLPVEHAAEEAASGVRTALDLLCSAMTNLKTQHGVDTRFGVNYDPAIGYRSELTFSKEWK